MPRRIPCLLLACTQALALTLAGCGAPPPADGQRGYGLDNGLRVILRPPAAAPRTARVVLYPVGADRDPVGRSGLAHFVERVYVTGGAGGAQGRTAEDLAARYPDGWNAQTGDDYTVAAAVFPPGRLGREVAAAARMGDLRPSRRDLERKRGRLRHLSSTPATGAPP